MVKDAKKNFIRSFDVRVTVAMKSLAEAVTGQDLAI